MESCKKTHRVTCSEYTFETLSRYGSPKSKPESRVLRRKRDSRSNICPPVVRTTRRFLVQQACIPPLCELLGVADVKIIVVALEALENILKVGEAESKASATSHNLMATHIAEAEGLKKIEDLQQHDNNDIYEKAVRILENYFGVDEEDVNIAPEAAGQNFAFGVQTPQAKAFDFGQGR